jgi:hypothetical protein
MSDQTPEIPERSIIWLTSRSAFEAGSQNCAMRRYLNYHAGPYGYGFARKATSVPLATGSYAHLGCTETAKWILDARQATGVQPTSAPDDVIRWAADCAVQKYLRVVARRGVLTFAQDDEASLARLQLLIAEQSTLIEGLIWTWCLVRLPQILSEYEILHVEEEESYVLDCTCGLGSGLGELDDHEARGCNGIGLMSKPDILARRYSDAAVGYCELKTAGEARRSWADAWERKQQFLIGAQAAERRLGEPVTHAWVEGLVKGRRSRDYGDSDGPKRQQSCLAYGYWQAPNPPLSVGGWLPAYESYDAEGIKHTPSRAKSGGHRKLGLWEGVTEELFPGLPEGMSRMEYWVKYLVGNWQWNLQKNLSVVGPLPKRAELIEKAERSFITEERLWQDRVWRVYDFSAATGKTWGDPDFHRHLDSVVPRSWNCDPFGPDHPCPYQPLCFEHEGWQQPVVGGTFVFRSPHHLPEAEQMKARGYEFDPALMEEEDEVEGD